MTNQVNVVLTLLDLSSSLLFVLFSLDEWCEASSPSRKSISRMAGGKMIPKITWRWDRGDKFSCIVSTDAESFLQHFLGYCIVDCRCKLSYAIIWKSTSKDDIYVWSVHCPSGSMDDAYSLNCQPEPGLIPGTNSVWVRLWFTTTVAWPGQVGLNILACNLKKKI